MRQRAVAACIYSEVRRLFIRLVVELWVVMTALKISYPELLDSHRQLVKKVRELREVRDLQKQEIKFLRQTLAEFGCSVFWKKDLN